MSLMLVNSKSNQQILLDSEGPFIIGRNNIAGCFDKKISREHGRITCMENGKINLVALHNNPCFFMRGGVPPICQLNKGEEETLKEGDCLGFLPNTFWFQISNTDVKLKKKLEGANESSKDLEPVRSESFKETSSETSETRKGEFSKGNTSDYSKRIGSPEFEKTKRLPLSMYETNKIMESEKRSNMDNYSTKPKKTKLETEKVSLEVVDYLPNPTTLTDEQVLEKKERDCDVAKLTMKNDDGNDKKKEPSTSNVCEVEKLADCVEIEEKGDSQKNRETEKNANCQKNKETFEGAKPDKTAKRPICQYDHSCYRKNPKHKLDFCHPNDPDYIPYLLRPICKYGEKCENRKNPRHKVEFRHFGLPSSSFASSSSTAPSSSFVSSINSPSSVASSPPVESSLEKVKRNPDSEEENDSDLDDRLVKNGTSGEYCPCDCNCEEFDESQEFRISKCKT